MRAYLGWFVRLLGPLLLVLFLLNSDLGQLVAILRGADAWAVLWSLALMFPFIIIKSWRWRLVLRELGQDLPMRTAMGLYTFGIYLGSITPGQAGDLAKAWYLRETLGKPLPPSLLSVVLDRLFDLVVMAVLATLGIAALGQLLPGQATRTLLIVAMGGGLTLFTVLLVAQKPRQWVLIRLLPALLPARFHASLHRWNEQLGELALHPRLILPAMVASLISALFTFYRLWLLFVALDVFIPLHVVVGVSALIAILQVLPVSIAGVGVRDAALIGVMASYGYTTEQALSVSALFLLLTIEHILAGFILSFWYPLGNVRAKVQEVQEVQAEAIPEVAQPE